MKNFKWWDWFKVIEEIEKKLELTLDQVLIALFQWEANSII